MDYLIYSDVSIDIDKNFASAYDINYVPMEYMLGTRAFPCTEPESDETMHEFYEQLRSKIETKTSQITPSHYIEIFEPAVKAGKAVLYIGLSGGLSDTCSSAQVAVRTLEEDYPGARIEIIDSFSATGGMGLLTETATINKKKGMSFEENVKWLREHVQNVRHWFKVEDLMYLMRGGRVSAATAILGTALSIKPILTINKDGKLETIDKKRGNRQAIKRLIEYFEESYDPELGNTVYISCADCLKDAAMVKDMLLEKYPQLQIRITMLSPIIGAHTGPDMLAVIHYGKNR